MEEELYFFEANAQLWVNDELTHKGSTVILRVGENLENSRYIDEDQRPLLPGVKAITNTLVQGILYNIHDAHQRDLYDSAAHLRYVIDQLEQGFIKVAYFEQKNHHES